MRFGVHIKTKGNLGGVARRAAAIGCETVQIFSGNPRSWTKGFFDQKSAIELKAQLASEGIQPLFVHASYLPNLASPDDALFSRSIALVAEELVRTQYLGADALVLHLGSGPDPLDRLVSGIKEAYRLAEVRPRMLVENSAGGGNRFGSRFAQIAALLDRLADLGIGLALDTAHACASGYALSSIEDWRRLIDEIEASVRLERLALIHGNDLLSACGSHLDRHWHIGRGTIGDGGFRAMGEMQELEALPVILETPGHDDARDRQNLSEMKRLARG